MVLFLSLVFALGLIIGSFLNCLAWRLYKEETIMGRSCCPKCKRRIAWYDNIPLVSFALLGGRCRSCGKKISWQYPLVELAVGALFVLAFWRAFSPYLITLPDGQRDFPVFVYAFHWPLRLAVLIARDWFLTSVLVLIFLMDLKWYVILDKVSLPACAIVLGLNLYLGLPWTGLGLAALVGAGFFLAQFLVSDGRWIGGGDIRLGLLMGLALGWPAILVALFIAYLLGSVIGLGLISFGNKKWESKVPFGVFLSTATLLALFYGPQILSWYKTL